MKLFFDKAVVLIASGPSMRTQLVISSSSI